MISAWACKNRLVLGQQKVDDKTNEIKAIPELLKILDIKGSTITIDAMGCQRKIAEQIHHQGGDYVLAVKENQGKLHAKIAALFAGAKEQGIDTVWHKKEETVDGDHGRIETRCYTVLPLMYLPSFKLRWKGLQSIAMVESKREIGDRVEEEKRYYITSLKPEVKAISHAIRRHWGIENKLHWCLDMAFRDDESRARIGHSAENLAVIRHIALNLLKREVTAKVGIKTKRSKAGWDHAYLAKVLAGA